MQSRNSIPATVSIDLNRSYNAGTREFNSTVNITALQNLTGEFKYNIMLLEDGIVWTQNGSLGGPNYVHDWTVRAMMNSALGEQLINGTWNQGQVITKNLTYTMPVPPAPAPDIVPDSCRVVVLVYKVGSPLNSAAEIQQAEDWTLISPNYVATMLTQSPDVITSNTTTAQYEAVIHNEGLMEDTYGISLSYDGPASWVIGFGTENGTFQMGQVDSVTVDSGDSTVVSVTLDPSATDGYGVVSLEFVSGHNPGANDVIPFRFVTETGVDMLVIDASDKEYEVSTTNSLDNVFMGTYGVASRTALHSGSASLSNFDAIFWAPGNSVPAFYPEEVTALETYFNGGGNLLIAGQDIGSDIFEANGQSQFAQGFYNNYLHASYVNNASNFFLVNGYTGDPITDGLQFIVNDVYSRSAEIIAPFDAEATAILKYMTGPNVAGIRAATNSYRVVYLGIALEQISDEADRDSIVARSIRWFEEGTTGIGDDPPVSYTFQLNQNYPNPFNPETMIQYVLDNAIPQQTKLVVYNSLGQAVRTLVNASQPAGSYQVMWDGRDDYGKQQASGIYYYQLTNGSQKAVQKMIMLR
jgi:hypothetical protein